MPGSFKFCPKCGRIMYPERGEGRLKFVCRFCGTTLEAGEGEEAYRINVRVRHSPTEKIAVIREGEQASGLQVVKGSVSCPKCGNDEAYFWMMQTRSADEPMTRFYRCTRCRHTWREYA